MSEIISHTDWQGFRQTIGSRIIFSFKNLAKAVSVKNLTSSGSFYFAFDRAADVGSEFPILQPRESFSANLTAGSVSIHGTDVGSFQVMGLL